MGKDDDRLTANFMRYLLLIVLGFGIVYGKIFCNNPPAIKSEQVQETRRE